MSKEVYRYTRPGFYYECEPVMILGGDKEPQIAYEAAMQLVHALNRRCRIVKFQPEKLEVGNARVMEEIMNMRSALDELEALLK